ncbi:60S ribosomal protein L27A-3, putative [Entamoeba invadens IP1]|nr:60S ribosomal protein L27A-3, putative [Entamoeba invadens IP1]ELP87811.1 60S ribosomal protein L27A-3, putative [Entamoeba invadens IP1]|eukprot:XP_004254582.1 60S ribosomal protein L27A-3, putative [Entamoeba invadens IP1]
MGYGRIGKHRKERGGRGNAGGLNHRRTWFTSFHPDFFGKKGMRVFHAKPNLKYCPSINVEGLWALVGAKVQEQYKNAKLGEQVPVIDCVKHGYFKVLGKGFLPKQPVIVRARFFSKTAQKKIQDVGGACELTA